MKIVRPSEKEYRTSKVHWIPEVEISFIISKTANPLHGHGYSWSWGLLTPVEFMGEVVELFSTGYDVHFAEVAFEHLKKLNLRVGKDYMKYLLKDDEFWNITYGSVLAVVDYYCQVYGINFDEHEMNDFVEHVLELNDEDFEILKDKAVNEKVFEGVQLEINSPRYDN